MNRVRVLITQLVLIVGLAACERQAVPQEIGSSTATPSVNGDGAAVPAEVTSAAGRGAIKGRVIATQSRAPLPNTAVWLAALYGEGADAKFVLDGARSPSAITNEQGEFMIANVEPQRYVVVVGDLYGKNVIISESSGNARVWPVAPDEVVDAKDLAVDLSQ